MKQIEGGGCAAVEICAAVESAEARRGANAAAGVVKGLASVLAAEAWRVSLSLPEEDARRMAAVFGPLWLLAEAQVEW